jgi:hypothetical protein
MARKNLTSISPNHLKINILKYLNVPYIRSLQHSMANFYREFPQLRCTELQLKMRLAGLHLQLKRVAHEQNTRLAVSSRAQRSNSLII